MHKRLIIAALAAALLALAFGAWRLGLTPAYVVHGAPVGSGMAAKLLCSARFVSGFSQEQARSDLEQYSPLLERVTVDWDEAGRAITTSLFGLSQRSANFVEGRGCAVDYGIYPPRTPIALAPAAPADAAWPLGGAVGPAEPALRELLGEIVARDNAAGRNTRVLLVAREGRIVAEAYAQETGPETPLLGWSMSKSLMAVMLGNLELRGMLQTDAPTGFAEWQGDDRAAIRLTDLLTMTDGLEFIENYSPGDDVSLMLFTEPSAAAYALQRPLVQAPGSLFSYSSGAAALLSLVHQRAFDGPQQALEDFVAQIWQPMGFRHGLFETDSAGLLLGSSYFYASARDWARLGQLMLQRGELNGDRIVSEDWVRRATSTNGSANERAYGYQWWLNAGDEELRYPDLPEDSIYARGNREQVMMVAPSLDMIILRMGWSAESYPVNETFREIIGFSAGNADASAGEAG